MSETPGMNRSIPGVPRWFAIAAHVPSVAALLSGIWRILAFVAGVPLLERINERHADDEVIGGTMYVLVLTVVSELAKAESAR
jgi:hypothetical protein